MAFSANFWIDGSGGNTPLSAANLDARETALAAYTDTQVALQIPLTQKAVPNGVASLTSGGTVPPAQLASGTRDGTKFLRDDGTWQTISTGGTPYTLPDATSSVKGGIQLAGDLGGTAAAPTVPGLATKAASTHTHDTSAVVSGTFSTSRLATGTPGAGKYIDGAAGAWTTLPGSGATPLYGRLPRHFNFKAWSSDPTTGTTSSPTLSPTATTSYYWRVYVPVTFSMTGFSMFLTTPASGATALANIFFGLYTSAGSRIMMSSDFSSLVTTAGEVRVTSGLTFASGTTITGGSADTGGSDVFIYARLYIATQATTPAVFRADGPSSNALQNIGLTAAPWYASTNTGETSAPPSTITPSGFPKGGASPWVGLF